MCARQAPPPDQIRTRGPGRGLEVSAQREWLSDPLDQTRSLGRYTRLQAGAGRGRAQQLPPPHDPPSSGPVPLSARPPPWEVCAGQGGRDYGRDDRSEPGLYSSLDPSSLHSAHPRCSPWDSGGEDGLPRAVASCPFPTLTCLLALSIPGWGHQSQGPRPSLALESSACQVCSPQPKTTVGGAGRVSCVPSMCLLRDPPVPCNPRNLPVGGWGEGPWGSLALGLHTQPRPLHIGVRVGVTARPASHRSPFCLSIKASPSQFHLPPFMPGTVQTRDNSFTITP